MRRLGRALTNPQLAFALVGQQEYEPRVLPGPTPCFGKGPPQNWGNQAHESAMGRHKTAMGTGQPATIRENPRGTLLASWPSQGDGEPE